ncbi:cyclic nucleotide-binding domain-containing protein [Couchioplanes caeruleus]|uniref:Crp/Fnr family transcriptional regulator n=1 Tax=Couchioplanes caeruleus TaxID=56438 RepID=UPI0020BDFB40|nr:cyclic nucleotide-binding domain-containing protein [Couchioplanes caeruleus]UQU61839.1 cyclic nucleotide-binding domain-containing protein [Couchioplanes caeruleus]
MSSLTVFDLLVLHPFLAGMPGARLRQVAGYGRPVVWPPGYRVFREDSPAANLWLLTAGEVDLDFSVPGRGEVVIGQVGGGELLGLSWLQPPRRWSVGAVASTQCHAVELEARGLRNLMAEDCAAGTDLAERFLRVLGRRLSEARRGLIPLGAVPDGAAGTLSRAAGDE